MSREAFETSATYKNIVDTLENKWRVWVEALLSSGRSLIHIGRDYRRESFASALGRFTESDSLIFRRRLPLRHSNTYCRRARAKFIHSFIHSFVQKRTKGGRCGMDKGWRVVWKRWGCERRVVDGFIRLSHSSFSYRRRSSDL